ncbi:unnamed protein product [[Actinomadura] parvosata subsp. kistnae]|nr:unnamed protein product [Actinomadura parvosata subsp. kistnae]
MMRHRELLRRPGSGGGVTGPKGRGAPLTDDEVAAALRALPRWSGDRSGLRRTLLLPQENLLAIRRALDQLKITYGRQPQLHDTPDGLTLLVRTVAVSAVTSLDLELARRVDELIDEIGRS